jgi:hypothetical protein
LQALTRRQDPGYRQSDRAVLSQSRKKQFIEKDGRKERKKERTI